MELSDVLKWNVLIEKFYPLWNTLRVSDKSLFILGLDGEYSSINTVLSEEEEALVKLMILWKNSPILIKESIEKYFREQNKEWIKDNWAKWSEPLKLPKKLISLQNG